MGVADATRIAIEHLVYRTFLRLGETRANAIFGEGHTQMGSANLLCFSYPIMIPEPLTGDEEEISKSLDPDSAVPKHATSVSWGTNFGQRSYEELLIAVTAGLTPGGIAALERLLGVPLGTMEPESVLPYSIMADILWGETFMQTMGPTPSDLLVGVLSARIHVPMEDVPNGLGTMYEIADQWRTVFNRQTYDLKHVASEFMGELALAKQARFRALGDSKLVFRASSGPQAIILPEERSLDPFQGYVVNTPFEVDSYPPSP